MKAAVIQSCYIPWKGYFDIIKSVDFFVFFDEVEFSKGSWRNRNKIKTPNGPKWLTIPLKKKNLNHLPIDEVEIRDPRWVENHLNKLRSAYSRAPFFQEYYPRIERLYFGASSSRLSQINQYLTIELARMLGIQTEFINSRDIHSEGQNEDKVISLLKAQGANRYLSGPSAKSYMTLSKWEDAGIDVEWKEYSYDEYEQLYPPFTHEVTVLDMFFCLGKEAPNYIWG